MRFLLLGACALTLAACQPTVPDSGARVPVGQGVGFKNYDAFEREKQAREAQIAAQRQAAAAAAAPVPATPAVTATPISPEAATPLPVQTARPQTQVQPQLQPVQTARAAPSASDDAREIAAQTQAALANSGVEPVQASPSNPAPQVVQVDTRGISNENDFNAVSQRDSIQGNAERLRQQRAQYQVVQPTAVPQRSGRSAPNIVKYALETRNARGQAVYRRTGFNLRNKHAKACALYASADVAQEAFLAAGGPQKDKNSLDIDGDGFACGWDPAPFRKAFRWPPRRIPRPILAPVVSAHYLICNQGVLYQMVEEDQRAWHAGAGSWGGVDDINSHSIGIELDNNGQVPFGAAQMDSLKDLLRGIMDRHAIPAHRIIGHSDGLSIWVDPPSGDGECFDRSATAFGYPITPHTLEAFRQRFRPDANGPEDAQDRAMMQALADAFPVDADQTPS